MTDKSWFEVDSSDAMALVKPDGTIHMFPSKIHKSAIAILDPILIPAFLEELDIMLVVTADIEEDIHHLLCEFVGADTTEHQDHDAMRWCYENDE